MSTGPRLAGGSHAGESEIPSDGFRLANLPRTPDTTEKKKIPAQVALATTHHHTRPNFPPSRRGRICDVTVGPRQPGDAGSTRFGPGNTLPRFIRRPPAPTTRASRYRLSPVAAAAMLGDLSLLAVASGSPVVLPPSKVRPRLAPASSFSPFSARGESASGYAELFSQLARLGAVPDVFALLLG